MTCRGRGREWLEPQSKHLALGMYSERIKKQNCVFERDPLAFLGPKVDTVTEIRHSQRAPGRKCGSGCVKQTAELHAGEWMTA